MTPQHETFDGLGIAPKLLEILDRLQFKTPTPIQFQSIPTALSGKDLMGIAQTGTGKTLAFGIPMIQRLAQQSGSRGLVVLPTRELALQVDEALHKIGRPLGMKTAVLIGGENMRKQIGQLHNRPHIIIATPGRLIDHLEQRTVKLDQVKILVLDEADWMLDMGFKPQITKILQSIPTVRQTMLFSATMPQEITQIANSYMKLPVRVEVAPAGTAIHLVTQELFFVRKEDKLSLLENLLKEYKGPVLVFTRTKFGAKKLSVSIRKMGHTAAEIHSNRSLNQRIEALSGFKVGKYRVMVATDIAARGIDVTGIELVINYDLPEQAEDYVHRIGRTGRAQHEGHAISFATPDQRFDVRAIERLIKKQLPVSQLPNLPLRSANDDRHSSFERDSQERFQRSQHRSPAFGGYRTPNRQAQENFGQHGRSRAAATPKPLRSPFARSKKSARKAPNRRGMFGNYQQHRTPRGMPKDGSF